MGDEECCLPSTQIQWTFTYTKKKLKNKMMSYIKLHKPYILFLDREIIMITLVLEKSYI